MDDLISRKEAIDELVRWGELPDYNEGERNVIACVIGMLSSLPSVQPEQSWIPVSERFPDKEMPVWVSMCDDDVLKAIWRNGWCAPNGYKMGLTDGQVIAWMPRQTIPEPYKEEGVE